MRCVTLAARVRTLEDWRLGRSTGSDGGREKGVRSSERYRYNSVYVNEDAPRISRMRVACKKARETDKLSCGRERIQWRQSEWWEKLLQWDSASLDTRRCIGRWTSYSSKVLRRETAALYLSLSHTGSFHHSAAGFGGQNEKKRLH